MKRMLQFKKTDAGYACFENDENVLVEYEQAYDASIGTLSTLDMNNYWYTNGRMTHQEALEKAETYMTNRNMNSLINRINKLK